jgi:hypothetical protein
MFLQMKRSRTDSMIDFGLKERDLGPVRPPNPGPRNEGAIYAAHGVEPMEIDTADATEMETSSSGYESSEGDVAVEEIISILKRLSLDE